MEISWVPISVSLSLYEIQQKKTTIHLVKALIFRWKYCQRDWKKHLKIRIKHSIKIMSTFPRPMCWIKTQWRIVRNRKWNRKKSYITNDSSLSFAYTLHSNIGNIQTDLFNLEIGPWKFLPLQVWTPQGIMILKVYSTLSRSPGLEPYHQMQSNVILRILSPNPWTTWGHQFNV